MALRTERFAVRLTAEQDALIPRAAEAEGTDLTNFTVTATAALLRDAITRAAAAAEIIGVRALLAHALHEQARAFYARFDFEPSPTDPLHLLLLIKDARAPLEPAQK